MNPLSALFGAGVDLRNALYDRGRLRVRRLPAPVVSIGNLSLGGAGKTPFVIALGELLKARGIEFDVLTRGYGRQTRGPARVDPSGSTRQFGDEPLLIARRLGVPVFVGGRRHEAGVLAERSLQPRLHLLDDGFQHRQLARDFDIVLLTPEDAQDRLLPVGRLRETLGALRRADAVVLTPGASPDGLPISGKLLWRVRRSIAVEQAPPRPVAFCGIARPQRFFQELRDAGVQAVAEVHFRDHHAYTPADVARLLKLKQEHAAGGFAATEKDAMNLGALAELLQPLLRVRVIMELLEPQAAIDAMLSLIARRRL
jgi:tetraacyldisaccharide 4'-kinase